MAKRTATKAGTALMIVESPTKARTIGRFLGPEFTIESSIGHIRDLPEGAKEIPTEIKGEKWAYLGVNIERDFEPIYIIPKQKAKQVRKLKELLKNAKELYLATDEDREGEAISWHLCEVLKPKVPVHRLVFHEITADAIREALRRPRQIDEALVRAQEARRIIDRLYGYDVSPLLWRKIRPRLSAGRVQSVAVRLIVERERQRRAFVPAKYWDLLGTFLTDRGEIVKAVLVSWRGRRIPEGRDFDPATGQLKNPELLLLDEREAHRLAQQLLQSGFHVGKVEDRPYAIKPAPPFTTSTLQQEANRKYGFTARYTMELAQNLYENGHITYMRTDSTSLAAAAVQAARALVAAQYGREYLPDEPRLYQTKVRNAQEAHEAIRPAGHPFALPEALEGKLKPDEFKLYDLIWKRTIASQMADAIARRTTILVSGGGAEFEAQGKTIEFPGYLRAYVEGSDDPEAELAEQDTTLPSVTEGQSLACQAMEPKGHATQPPSRYTEASLTRALEELGIGRPSTYATIIDTILARQYVFKLKRSNVLVPTWTAFAVCRLLEDHLPELVDYGFTAEMEDELDAISRGELGHVEYLRQFYFGNKHPGLKAQVDSKREQIDARDVSRIFIGQPPGEEPIYVRVGRYGPFLEQGERRASIPDKMPPDELTVETALAILEKSATAEKPLGICPETGKPIHVRVGRFGPYVQRGDATDDEKPLSASLPPGMSPQDITLETALKLLALPRALGLHPETGLPVEVHNGRYGPFIRCGEQTRSLPAGLSLLEVTLDQAVSILAQPKGQGRSAHSTPLRVLGTSPATGEPMRVMVGRYGPYITDGATNVSLPQGVSPEQVTFEQAAALLAERAAKGPSRRFSRKSSRKKAVKASFRASSKASTKTTTKAATKASVKAASKASLEKPEKASAKTPRKKPPPQKSGQSP